MVENGKGILVFGRIVRLVSRWANPENKFS